MVSTRQNIGFASEINLKESLEQLKLFLVSAKLIETADNSFESSKEVPKEIIEISPKLWDPSQCNISGNQLAQWFNKVSVYYMQLMATCLAHNSHQSIILLLKSFCISGLPLTSLSFRINLLKNIFGLWSSLYMRKNNLDKSTFLVFKEFFRALIFLINQYDRPSENLCEFDSILNFIQAFTSTSETLFIEAHNYYRVIYMLLLKKDHKALIENLILQYFDFTASQLQNCSEQCIESLKKAFSESFMLFVSNSINYATLKFLFNLWSHHIFQNKSQHLQYLQSLTPYLVLSAIFEGSLSKFKALEVIIGSEMPSVNLDNLKKKIHSRILMQMAEKQGRGDNQKPLAFKFCDIAKALEINEGEIDRKIRDIVLYLARCCGTGTFMIDSSQKCIIVRNLHLLRGKYRIAQTSDIEALTEKINTLESCLNKLSQVSAESV